MDLDFFREIVALAREHGTLIVHDFAYADLGFDGYKPPSILQVEGAKEVAVEIFSLSKSYNMAGWRVGFCLGNQKMIAALARIKSYLDYGVFQPIQIASIIALRECEEDTKKICAIYQKRRDVLVTGLKRAGWPVEKPRGSMFLWAPLPEKYRAAGSLEFCKLLLEKAQVAVSPGIGFGPLGRRPRPLRPGGKRAAHPPGHPRHRPILQTVEVCWRRRRFGGEPLTEPRPLGSDLPTAPDIRLPHPPSSADSRPYCCTPGTSAFRSPRPDPRAHWRPP